mmetsp:Transcript_1163/g.2860  ORF Transcript_1163/g.2860 Transcript_1163/m.2860 type:complete len:428 (-) Transcript_1163:90-1373(-)
MPSTWLRSETCSEEDVRFQRRAAFVGLLGVTFACIVHLMTLLRPVLEPFLWALFLVMALQPLAVYFESLLLRVGHRLCRRCHTRAIARQGSDLAAAIFDDENGDDSEDPIEDLEEEHFCDVFCAGFSRVVAVTSALVVVLGVFGGMVLLLVNAALNIKDNFAIYELGSHNAANRVQELFARVSLRLPKSLVDSILDNVLERTKRLVSDLLGSILAHAGKILFEFVMLALYVMFWLCAPMPMHSGAGHIFRRYLLLKGAACICYGSCVWAVLSALAVDIPAVFGLLSFILSFLPEVGALVAMILPAPVILFDSRLEEPWLTLLTATLAQMGLKLVFANIVEVLLVEQDAAMKMHPVITLLAFAFFGFIWGPTGMLLSVPLMAYVKAVVLSDVVPLAYRNPILIVLEGDRRAPEQHLRRASMLHSVEPR